MKEEQDDSTNCDFCRERMPVKFCDVCSIDYCKDCKLDHEALHDHVTEPITFCEESEEAYELEGIDYE